MIDPLFRKTIFLAPDHGGDNIKGGGHPSDSTVSADEEIQDALGNMTPGRAGIPGTNDPGPGGSRTNTGQGKPLDDEETRESPGRSPGRPTGEGSGAGSG